MIRRTGQFQVTAVAVGIALCITSGTVNAQTTFQGKIVNVIINSNPGGGTDTYGRMITAAMAPYLPGNPDITIRNMPGGGGIQANNYFYSQVKPDGLTIIASSNTQLSPPKLRNQAVKYNPDEYRYIGGTERLGSVLIARHSKMAQLTNAKAEPLIHGDIDGERDGLVAGLWAKDVLGWNVRFVVGYAGVSAVELAARRGEIDVFANGNASIIKRLIGEGFQPLAQIGTRDDNDKIVRRAGFESVPLLDELLLPKLSGASLKAYQSWRGDQLVDKWLALPPKTPDALVEIYRKAYQATVGDPKNAETFRKTFGEDWTSYAGPSMEKIVKGLVATSQEDVDYVIALRKKHGLPGSN